MRLIPAAVLAAVLLPTMLRGQTVAPTANNPDLPSQEPKTPVSFDLGAIDASADPCVDFYKFACGNWQKANPIPDTKTRWGQFDVLAEHNRYLLYRELQAAAAAPKTPLQTQYGAYFAACMDATLADALGAKPLAPNLALIATLKDRKQLTAIELEIDRRFGHPTFFNVGVVQDLKDATKQILASSQGSLGLPDRDYYLAEDDRSKKLRDRYVAHVARMFVLLGDSPERAAAEAADVLRIETALAQAQLSRVELRDPDKRYNIVPLAELQAMSPALDWSAYLAGLGLSQVAAVDVYSPKYVAALNALIASEPISALQSYLRWVEVHAEAGELSQPFVDENFSFYGNVLNGQKQITPRWLRCTQATDAALGEAVGQDWVRQNFPPQAKASMEKLVATLEHALDEDIATLPWMSPETKAQAHAKLALIRNKIGYPERWRDYSALTVKRDDPVGNDERASVFEDKRDLAKFGKPVDQAEWSMTPPTVNAYYNGSNNDINFPAGILQPPFFDDKTSLAVNFGGIGVVIGHEMTHGFDDQGAKRDGLGNRKDWFTKDDLAQFNERTACIADQYSGFDAAPGQKLNGRLTLGENTADNGGLRIAFQALMDTLAAQPASAEQGKIDGYTPQQRFFIGFGQVWCENMREETARVRAKTDPHSSGQWRVRGAVENFDEFGKAFSCKVGQPMMPEKSCRVW